MKRKICNGKENAIIMIGGGWLQIPAIRQIKQQGLVPVVTDGSFACPAVHQEPYIDFYNIDTYNISQHIVTADTWEKIYNIKGVMTCGADVAPTVAALSERFSLPGIPLKVAEASHCKASVRAILQTNGLQVFSPGFRCFRAVSLNEDTAKIAQHIRSEVEQGFGNFNLSFSSGGIVLKPLSSCASRGITILTPEAFFKTNNLEQAIGEVLRYGKDLLAEELLEGSEHSCELLFDTTGSPVFRNIVDRVFRYDNGHAIELGHINPTKLLPDKQAEIYRMCAAAATALGVKWGPFKCDVIYTKNGPKILECTARLSGGFDCQYTTPIASGRNPIGDLILLCQGYDAIPENSMLEWQGFAAACGVLPKPGIVDAIQGSLFQEPDIENMRGGDVMSLITVNPGDVIEDYKNCAQRAGFSITGADSYQEAWQRARKGAAAIEKRIFMR